MEKSELKTGMICKTREGSKCIIWQHVLVNTRLDPLIGLSALSNDLRNTSGYILSREYDIMKVYDSEMNILWMREEGLKEVTLQEIADKMGIPVNQLRIKKD